MDVEKIQRLMKKKKLSYAALGRKMGMDWTVVWRIVNEVTTDPRIETVKTIASALGVKVDDIILQDY